MMVYLKCAAACGDFDLCLIACPYNAQLNSDIIPICVCDRAGLTNGDEEVLIVEERLIDRES